VLDENKLFVSLCIAEALKRVLESAKEEVLETSET